MLPSGLPFPDGAAFLFFRLEASLVAIVSAVLRIRAGGSPKRSAIRFVAYCCRLVSWAHHHISAKEMSQKCPIFLFNCRAVKSHHAYSRAPAPPIVLVQVQPLSQPPVDASNSPSHPTIAPPVIAASTQGPTAFLHQCPQPSKSSIPRFFNLE
jgi:hypothetical protein